MRKIVLALSLLAVSIHAHSADFLMASGVSWSEEEIALARSLSLDALPPIPEDPSNRVADDPRAIELGRALFHDTRLSSNGKVACATCHLPNRQFQDDRPLAHGVGETSRRTMPIAGMAYSPFLFWDGRKDSLWAQALGPLESAVEHGGNRTMFAHLISAYYRDSYEALFGALPDMVSLPADAGPIAEAKSASAWQELDEADQESVNAVFANIGKAIAAYERTITPPRTRFDDWIASPAFPAPGSLNKEEIEGLRVFVGKGRCVTCHNGPLFTDNYFHNTGVSEPKGQAQDRGRATGARLLGEDMFNCLGRYSDAEPDQCTELRFLVTEDRSMIGAFKTPSLRGVAGRPPYMHAGQIENLSDVVDHYVAAKEAPVGHSELRALSLDAQDRADLIAFLRSLEEVR
ncbi:cytochrome-c peroxidase [Rhizobium setariae]|nr:cytochrome c peroxidase [Rhizobium setariae]